KGRRRRRETLTAHHNRFIHSPSPQTRSPSSYFREVFQRVQIFVTAVHSSSLSSPLSQRKPGGRAWASVPASHRTHRVPPRKNKPSTAPTVPKLRVAFWSAAACRRFPLVARLPPARLK